MDLKIIIPVLNEEKELSKEHFRLFIKEWGDDIIIVDSGSQDRSIEKIKELGCEYYEVEQNSISGAVLNVCEKVTSDYILILPVDCYISNRDLLELKAKLVKVDVKWGGFLKEYTRKSFFISLYLFLQNEVRTKLLKNLVWTNVIFCKRQLFINTASTEGFLEDVILSDTLKRYSAPLILKGPVTSSFRRYQGRLMKRLYVNLKIMIYFRLGIKSISELKKTYLS